MEPARILLASVVDYAGLFPPSGKGMAEVVANYASYRRSPDAWMLGRLIVPVARLEEFEDAASGLLPTGEDDEPWPISALVRPGAADEEIDRIFAFNLAHAEDPSRGLAVIDTFETPCPAPGEVDALLRVVPEQLTPYLEVPADGEIRGHIAALAGTGARAKIRCGGVTPDAFPAPERVASFLALCAAADVPFKATAGLHHPVRAEQNLSYDPDPPRGVMHGFVNVFLGAALLAARRIDEAACVQLLAEADAGAFRFGEAGAAWRDREIDGARLARARESFAVSFGSCSFEEPTADLRALGWIA